MYVMTGLLSPKLCNITKVYPSPVVQFAITRMKDFPVILKHIEFLGNLMLLHVITPFSQGENRLPNAESRRDIYIEHSLTLV